MLKGAAGLRYGCNIFARGYRHFFVGAAAAFKRSISGRAVIRASYRNGTVAE